MDLKKLIALSITASFLIGGSSVLLPNAEAKPINDTKKKESKMKQNYNMTQKERVEISFFKKRTDMKDEDIAKLLKKGFVRDDIKAIYVISLISTEKMEDIINIYQNEEKDIDMVLKDFKLDNDKYKEQLEKTFPEGDETDFDRVVSTKPVWSLAPPK